MEQSSKEAKVLEYERFVEERLKVDLQQAMDDRQKYLEEIQVEDLSKNLDGLESRGTQEMDCLVDLGSDVLAQAHVPDTSTIFISVGLGFFLEFTHLEAQEFIEQKLKHLKKLADARSDKIATIKADIKLVVEGIRELLNIPDQED